MPRPRILIVKDERLTETGLASILEKQGYQVILTAPTGENAIPAAVETEPDLVLMDIGPGGETNAVDAAAEIRRTLDVPIVYVTAHFDQEFLEKTKATESYGYVTKPFGEAQLSAVVETALARHQAETRLKTTWERLDLALEVSDVAMWEWNVQTGEVTTERHWSQILEILPDEIGRHGDWWAKVIHPDDVALIGKSIYDHLEDRTASYQGEFRVRTGSGQWKWLLGRGRMMERDTDGKPLRLAGTVIDITDRKQTEVLLIAQRELSTALNRVSSLTEALELCVKTALAASEMDSAGVYLVNDDFSMDLAVHTGLSGEFIEAVSHLPSDSPRVVTIMRGQSVYVEGLEASECFHSRPDGEGLQSLAVIPVSHEGKVIACFNVASHTSAEISPRTRQVLETIGAQVGGAIAGKLAEESLRKNEELFRTIVATSPVGILLAKNRVLEWVSESWMEMFGFQHLSECIGRSSRLIYASDTEYDRVAKVLYNGLESGAVTRVDARLMRKDGSVFDGHLKMKALDASDLGKGVIAAISDISDRKQAERELQLEKERFETLTHSAPFAMILIGQDGTFEYVNPKFRELLGYDLSDVPTGKHWFRSAYPDPSYRHEVIAAWIDDQERFQARMTRPRTFTVTCKDGSKKTIHFRTVLLSTGYHLLTCEDITERIQADEARMRLAAAVEQAAEAMVITDTDGVIEYVNPAFETITGYTSIEVVGENPRLLKSGEHDEAFYETLWQTISRGEAWSGRFINRRKDDALYQADATISPVRDLSGKIINYVAVMRDVTQEVRLEKQLLQSQKMEAIGTLAGGIAHDFNNLLQIVLGFAELLIMKAPPDGHSSGEVKAIAKAARDGAELVRRLLTFSRKAETKPRPLDLNQVVTQAEQLLRRTIPKMIAIELNLAQNLTPIDADPAQIEQLLLNLAVNSRDAMPEGGRLFIETSTVRLDDRYCATHVEAKPGQYVQLAVSDTGHGMEKGVVDHIFEPFFTTKKPGEGTGLGLSMVYGIVKGHGGHITCYSETGVGTTFKIYLPSIEMDLEPDVVLIKETATFGTETILLVDDEELIRELGKEILIQSGYTVLTACNGKEALDIYRDSTDRIDLVILDLLMPEMGGKQCLAELLKLDPEARVLLASGYPAYGSANDSLAAAKGFVNKPFDAHELLRSARRVLDKS